MTQLDDQGWLESYIAQAGAVAGELAAERHAARAVGEDDGGNGRYPLSPAAVMA